VKAYLLIALGSGFGGVARHWLSTLIAARITSPVPWPTLIVNVIGSALIGFVLASSELRPGAKQFLAVGVLGGFTTFSAFSAQTLELFQAGKPALACAYAAGSVFACVLGCSLAWTIAGGK
jgi:protein CrcB